MFCFCSNPMTFANDNRPPAPEASRILPILGRVAADGRIVPRPAPAPVADAPTWSPNDPREA
jgi:hypothetical protein